MNFQKSYLDRLITSNMRGYSVNICNYEDCGILAKNAFIASIGGEVFFFRFCGEHSIITPPEWGKVSLDEAMVLEIIDG